MISSGQKKWQVKTREQKLPSFLKEYPSVVAQLLLARNLKTKKQVADFLQPDFIQGLNDSWLLQDMRKAVACLQRAIKNQEPMAIFGDYDADGVSGAAILETALRRLKANVKSVYIPDRHKEGYGLNVKAVKHLASEGIKLIVTVDCGIVNYEEVEEAKKLGVEVIITDHHQVPSKLPPALAVINPHRHGDKYPFKELSGAGVAFKLVQALFEKQKIPHFINFLKWQLDLVALATVADCVSLTGENRVLVKYGLLVMAQTKRMGLKELLAVAGIKPSCNVGELCSNLDTFSLAFLLAPRINAAGRMEHANTAYELLMTESENEARWLAQRLDSKNRERQSEIEKILRKIEKNLRGKKEEIFILEGDADFNLGVVGLVAGRLAEKYAKPAVVYARESGIIKGSIRGVDGFNIMKALRLADDLFMAYGGHPGAAGFSLPEKNLAEFKKRFTQGIKKQLKTALTPTLEIDQELELQNKEEVNNIYSYIRQMAPFGKGNEEPVFLAKKMKIVNMKIVGNGNGHLKLELESSQGKADLFEAIGFFMGERQREVKIGETIDIVFRFLEDEWNGVKRLSLKMVDFRKVN